MHLRAIRNPHRVILRMPHRNKKSISMSKKEGAVDLPFLPFLKTDL